MITICLLVSVGMLAIVTHNPWWAYAAGAFSVLVFVAEHRYLHYYFEMDRE